MKVDKNIRNRADVDIASNGSGVGNGNPGDSHSQCVNQTVVPVLSFYTVYSAPMSWSSTAMRFVIGHTTLNVNPNLNVNPKFHIVQGLVTQLVISLVHLNVNPKTWTLWLWETV